MSEDARARERLDFEAAAEVIERGKLGKDLSTHEFNGILTTSKMQFTSGGEEVCIIGVPWDGLWKTLWFALFPCLKHWIYNKILCLDTAC